MENLTPDSIEWAIQHLCKHGDSDILPVPFEFLAIRHDWAQIRAYLLTIDLEKYSPSNVRRFLVPKTEKSYRVVNQFDPLDTLIFTAMTYEVAELVEAYRIPVDERISCSYRLNITSDGDFFSPDKGWHDFQERSRELSEDASCTHVVVADIVDFYNHIYHHRIKSMLESAGVPSIRAACFERFLSKTAGQSRGIPIGPDASFIVSEGILHDVDSRLLLSGFTHVRYVDDFRIFCRSKREAIMAIHDLTEYLYTSHRLSLQSSKTNILPKERFVETVLNAPEDQEEQRKISIIKDFFDELEGIDWYDFDPEEVEFDDNELIRDALKQLLTECVENPTLHTGVAKYVLRRAKALKTIDLYPIVFENLDKLVPVFRDVATYLMATKTKIERRNQEVLMDFALNSIYSQTPFIMKWILYLFSELPVQLPERDIVQLAEQSIHITSVRPLALIAKNLDMTEWVRAEKETWASHRPWDKRGIIFASTVLPEDERQHWLRIIVGGDNPLDRAVASYILGTS